MKFFRHNEVPDAPPVSAMQVSQQTIAEIAVWSHGLVVKELISGEDPEKKESWMVGINVPAMGGMDRASEGDFVVRDMAGALHVFNGQEFLSMFTEVRSVPLPTHNNVREMRAQQRKARDG